MNAQSYPSNGRRRQGKTGSPNNQSQSTFLCFNVCKQTFQTVQRRIFLGIEHLPDVIHGFVHLPDGFGHHGAGGVGVAAALESFRDLDRLAIAVAEAGDDGVVRVAEQGNADFGN